LKFEHVVIAFRQPPTFSFTHFFSRTLETTKVWAAAIGGVLFVVWYVFLRPRRGGKDAPPLASDFGGGPFPVPIVGHLMEFFSSPNSMIQRCTKEIGPVFTIPVRLST
jgi:hypothetical protein